MTKEELKALMKEIEAEEVAEELEVEEVEEEEKKEEDKAPESEAEVSVDADALAEKLYSRIAKSIADASGETKKDQKKIKQKLFNKKGMLQGYPTNGQLDSLSKDQKIVTFMKALIHSREDPEAMRVLKALNEGTAAEGGYLVPEELRAEIWRILPDFAVMRRLARVLPMTTDTLLLNKLTALPEAYWTAEYASKTTSSAEFGQISLTPYKLVCLLPVTEELIADANIDVVNFILELFAERIGTKEDQAFFTGTGTAQPTGLVTSLGTAVNAGNNGTFDNILDLIYSVPQAARGTVRRGTGGSVAFVANFKTIKNLRKLKDSNGQPIWAPGHPDNGDPDRMYGYPVFEQNALADGTIVFGDYRFYIIGDRQSLVVRTTMEGGDAWRRDAMEIKAKVRVDGEVIITAMFGKLINF